MREFSSPTHLDLTVGRDPCPMSRVATRPQLDDEKLPGFGELLNRPIPGPVSAVYETAGSSIDSIATIQVTWHPGRQVTVRYRVIAAGGSLPGQHDVVAVVGRVPDEAAVVEGPESRVGVWVVPNDPLLPGLRSALDLPTVANLVSDLGADDEVTYSRLRAYRPGRRAVVEVGAGQSSIYLKIVPPGEVADLHDRHRHLSEFLPVPDSLGLAPDLGIVAMGALPGADLRSTLRNGGAVPNPSAIAGIVDRLPDPRNGWQARTPIETVPKIVELLGRLLPAESERLNRLQSEIGQGGARDRVPVHGDFHEAQIMVKSGTPVGLIDVDTYGWGHPGHDAATMLGHLHLLAPGCKSPSLVMELARNLNRHWDAEFDPVDLRHQTAAVVLGLATGPFRVQSPNWPRDTRSRIDVAEEWVDSARRVDERSLIAASGGSHDRVG